LGKELSVIIVNYNVSAFLKLCLFSVRKASGSLDVEVFVVDNASEDDSVEMVKREFPEVQLIGNKENVGFSKANNQAIDLATGRIILILNPDTIIPEYTFTRLLKFYDEHPDASGVGIKMIDGTGRYLPESKRGLPSTRDFIYRFSGLSTLFPRSKIFSRYYAGHLSPDKTWVVQVLAGAFIAFPSKITDKIGALDEDFFMYGEDIDFSYRLSFEGNNYYYPEITIIHFKGESTVRDKDYINRFYGAMLIFTKKHFFTKYNRVQKRMISFFIKLIINFLKFTLIFHKKKKTEEGVPSDSFIYVGSEKGYDILHNAGGYKNILRVNSFDEIDTSITKKEKVGTGIIVDTGYVRLSKLVEFMKDNSDEFVYSFMSYDHSFCLTSAGADSTGQIRYF